MDTNRRIAVITGVMFIIATVGALASSAFLTPILNAPDYLTKISANHDQFLWGVFLQFIAGVACPAIALAMYPILRKNNEGLALGSVGFRLIEGALYVILVVVLLLLMTLSQETVRAGVPTQAAFTVPAALLMASRDWLGPVAALLTFGIGAFMYYWALYRSRLIPRWLSGWGIVAIVLVMVSGLLVMFGRAAPLSTSQIILALPIAVQEMVLAIWLIGKGFNPAALGDRAAADTSREPTVVASTTAAVSV
jgi:hypothetical protein